MDERHVVVVAKLQLYREEGIPCFELPRSIPDNWTSEAKEEIHAY
jgi:hypothetical protein